MAQVIAPDGVGGNGSSTTPYASISGISPTSFDVYTNAQKNSMFCSLVGASTITIYNRSSSTMYLFAAYIFVNGVKVGQASEVYRLTSSSASYSLTGTTIGAGSSKTFNVVRTNDSTTFSSSGVKEITVTLKTYTSSGKNCGRDPNGASLYWCSSQDINGGYVFAYNQILSGISVSGAITGFYKNGTFNYNGLSVIANYKYYVDGSHSGSTTISSGYSVSTPSLTSAGQKTVTVTYSGKTASYTINVYGVKSYTTPKFASNQKINATQPSLDNVTVTYDDDSTSSESVSVSGWSTGSTGQKTITYSFTASKTGETFTYTSKINVRDYNLVLDVTNIEKKNYSYNATSIDTTGLVIKKVYGNGLTDDPVSVDSCSFEKGEWDTGADTGEIIVTYDDDTSKNASYRVNVNGLAYITLDTSNATTRFAKGTPFIKNGVIITPTEYVDGELVDQAAWSGSVVQEPNPVSMDDVGTKTIALSIAKNGKTVSASYDIIVYDHKSLKLTNAPSLVFKNGDSLPNLSLGGLVVEAEIDEGDGDTYYETLSSYTVSPTVGSTLQLGTNTITITSALGASKSFDIVVEADGPKADATISVSGSLSKEIYLPGDTVSLSELTVQVSEMKSGLKNYTVGFVGKLVEHGEEDERGLTFSDEDTPAYYDLLIYVDGIEDPYVIENAVCLKGLVSVSYDESRTSNGYFIGDNKVGNLNRVKIGQGINPNAIKYRKHYSDGTTEDVFDSSLISSIKVDSVAKTKFNYADADDTTNQFIAFDIVINGSSFTMNVPYKYVSAISITNNKTAYDIHDALDTSKITLKKTYKYHSLNGGYTDQENLSIDDVTISFTGGGTGCSKTNLVPEDTRMSASVILNTSFSEGDAPSVTATNTLTVKALRGVTLIDENTNIVSKVAYEYGENHSLEGLSLYVIFNTNETITRAIEDDNDEYPYKGSKIATDTAISTSISYPYKNGDSVSCSYTIHCRYLSDITVDFSSVTGDTLYQHDTLSVAGITATRTIASTDEEDSSYPKTTDITDDLRFAFNGQNVDKAVGYYLVNTGTFNLVASYTFNGQPVSKTQALTIVAVVLESISLTKANTFKDFEDYVEEQNLNLSGLTVNLVYNKTASNHTISYTDPNVQIVDGDGAVFSKTKELDLDDDGTELLVKYSENGVTKYVSIGTLGIAAKELDHLNIRNNPTKVNYYYGDSFSFDGMVVEAVFNNGKSEVVANSQLTITNGVALGHTFDPSDDGTTFEAKSVTLSYTHSEITKTKNLSYNLLSPVLSSIKHNVNDSSEPVKKRFTDGDTFDSSGLVVTAVMTNGYEVVLSNLTYSLDATALCLDGSNKIQLHANSKEYGSKTLIITGVNPYNANESKTTSYDVEVTTSGAVVSAVMQIGEGADLYLVGEQYSAKGVSFKVTDIDGNVFNVTNFTADIEKGTIFRSASRRTVKVTYTNGDYTKTEEYKILISVPNKIELTEENTYQLAIGYYLDGALFTALVDKDENEIKFGKQYDDYGNIVSELYPLFHEDKISVDDNPLHENTYGYNVYTGSDPQKDCIGYIDLGIDNVKNAHIVLFDDPTNPIEGDGNIEVTFPHYVRGYADRINQARFGRIFHNRLFVSGNPNEKNCDWWTSDINIGGLSEDYDNVALHDLTYFSDQNKCYYGNSDTAVIGYDQYRDGDLIVIKEGSRDQATIFRREYKIIEATSADGSKAGEDLYEESFPMFDVNSNGGIGGLSNRSIINFLGESLMLTKEGLKAITNKGNAYNNMKYTYDVSSFINAKILAEDLPNAHMFTYKDKLILRTSRGVYVGYNELRNYRNEYEWYFLDNINADYFFELDDELYFANDNGDVCRFPNDLFNYIDKQRIYVGLGGTALTVNETADSIVISSDYKDYVKEGNAFHLLTSYNVAGADINTQVHASLGTFVDKNVRQNAIDRGISFDQTLYNGLVDFDNNCIIVKPFNSDSTVNDEKLDDIKVLFYEGRVVYLDSLVGSGIQVNIDEPYTLKQIDTNKYKLLDQFGEEANLIGIEYVRISFVVNDLVMTRMTQITNYGTSGAKQFKLIGDHEKVLDLIHYNNRNNGYSGVITLNEIVKAFFITAPYAFKNISLYKTVWSWSIVNDTQFGGYVDVGFFADRAQGNFNYAIQSALSNQGLDFTNFSFVGFEFLSDNLPATHTVQRRVANVGYMRFIFKNDKDTNMVLAAFNIVYTYSNLMKGVK